MVKGVTDFGVKWRLKMDASYSLADGAKEEKSFVFDPRKFSTKLITAYQKYLRPSIPPGCRFEPGCSEYTKQAILKYGLTKGVFKGLIRILHCHPFSGKSGYDPLV